jgi:hypothetical protein
MHTFAFAHLAVAYRLQIMLRGRNKGEGGGGGIEAKALKKTNVPTGFEPCSNCKFFMIEITQHNGHN